jgi:hypothetical protein
VLILTSFFFKMKNENLGPLIPCYFCGSKGKLMMAVVSSI